MAIGIRAQKYHSEIILKKVAANHVPSECIYRPKEGFSIPIKHWLNNELVLDHIDSSPNWHREGKIALQVHDGTKMKAYFKNIRITEIVDEK